MNSSLWSWQQTRTSPNGCSQCGEQERGHTEAHGYTPPTDALRLARMRARRDARLNPPSRPAPPPNTVLTLTAYADDFIDALRYVGDHARLFDEAAHALAARLRGPAAERARDIRVIAISTPGTSTQSIHRPRCRCSLVPVLDPDSQPVAGRTETRIRDGDWPEQGSTCAHVCGPDPGHVCDAKAVTSLRHTLPSGGVRDLPLCGPCARAESAEPGVPN